MKINGVELGNWQETVLNEIFKIAEEKLIAETKSGSRYDEVATANKKLHTLNTLKTILGLNK